MQRAIIFIFTFLFLSQVSGQNAVFYKTTKKQHTHYIELNNEVARVYKMGYYLDKAGSGPSILKTDTLYKISESEFKGKFYSLNRSADSYILQTDNNKKLSTVQETDLKKVNTTLNNAYFLKSYFELSNKINKAFPLYHYSFRNGFYAWDTLPEKSYDHEEFIKFTDNKIRSVWDSIYNLPAEIKTFTKND